MRTEFTLLASMSLATLLACGGGDDSTGPSDNLVAMTVSGQTHESGSVPVLTVTSVLGPSGASVTNIRPGRYVARGSYNYSGLFTGPATMELTFNGTYSYTPANKHDQTVTTPTGSFEVSVTVNAWTSGAGNPRVCIFPGTQIAGSSADCVRMF